MNDPGPPPLAILRSRIHDAHRAAIVLDDFSDLKLVVEARHRPFGRSAVDVEDVVEGLVHGALGHGVGTSGKQNLDADERT